MDAAGVAAALVSQCKRWSCERQWMCAETRLEEVARYTAASTRFGGLAGYNPYDAAESLREMEAAHALGLRGTYLHAASFQVRLGDAQLYPLYAKSVELGMPVVVEMPFDKLRAGSGQALPVEGDRPFDKLRAGRTSDDPSTGSGQALPVEGDRRTSDDPSTGSGQAPSTSSGLRLCIERVGRDFPELRLAVVASRPTMELLEAAPGFDGLAFVLDTEALSWMQRQGPPQSSGLLRPHIVERCMWGSHRAPLADSVRAANALDVPDYVLEAVLRTNALRYFGSGLSHRTPAALSTEITVAER